MYLLYYYPLEISLFSNGRKKERIPKEQVLGRI